MKKIRSKKFDFKRFAAALSDLKAEKAISEGKNGFTIAKPEKTVSAKVIRLNKTFGFVSVLESGEEIFVAGKYLLGAMPGDIVKLRIFKGRNGLDEGEVMSISEENFSRFAGTVVFDSDSKEYKITSSELSKFPLPFENPDRIAFCEGDRVLAEITYRGRRHSEHRCRLVMNFGNSDKASVCAESVLAENGISLTFPHEVVSEAVKVSLQETVSGEIKNRLDLRDMPIFTIDGADTKDIDDAISVEKTENGFKLGVHIADVSFYVKPKSALDNEAFERGTSVYYANRVVPMLPRELSNGICSLNPSEDRLAFSCLINTDFEGNMLSYRFVKSVIRSRVKGVYSEINDILDGRASDDIKLKYSEVASSFDDIAELALKLSDKKRKRGAPELESVESKILVDENDVCVGVLPRRRGKSEEFIEDFMLLANEAAAKFGAENELPFVFRIHEQPKPEKVDSLYETLTSLGVAYPQHKPSEITQQAVCSILESVKGTELSLVVNNLVLRTMAKAKYSNEPVGHYGLVLSDYAHFTSPIRRYPDLAIHRIMSEFISGVPRSEICRKYNKFSYAASQSSSEAEQRAMKVEMTCEDMYKAEFMKSKIGQTETGTITSVTDFGVFVTLDDTCEGLIRTEDLPDGEYRFDGAVTLTNLNTGKSYRTGDRLDIRVLNADVALGRVDFGLV